MTKIIKPNNETAILLGNVLDTGMKAEEAIRRAANWWNNKGRLMMLRELKRQSQKGGRDKTNGGAFASLNPDSANFLPSKIIHGFPWEELGKMDRLKVVKVWHHFNIRVPKEGLGKASYEMGDTDVIQ